MNARAALCALIVALATASAAAQSEETVDPDRPDFTNGAHIVPRGHLQVEIGGVYTHGAPGAHAAGSPFTARVGVRDWIELRAGGDGWLEQSGADGRASGFGNVQLAAKIRLAAAAADGAALVSVLPAINLPAASAAKGLGSGDPDYTIALLTGCDLGSHAHVDVNYGVGAIGGGGGTHFVQHTGSASGSVAVGQRLAPYAELFWLSRQEAGGHPVAAFDAGAIYTASARVALDGGALAGISGAAPDWSAFAGVSILVGHSNRATPRSRFRSSGDKPKRVPISRTVASRRISAAPTASTS